jgi:uncharacterized protein with HEPN domain
MLPESRDAAYLWDMLQASRKAVRSVEGLSFPDYQRDEDLRLTVERRMEIIGEAARRISQSFREAHPEVPWRGLVGLRNVMAHEYDEIDHERVWKVVKDQLPGLVRTLETLVPAPPPEAG